MKTCIWRCFFPIIPLICTTQAHIIYTFPHGVDLCCMSLKLLLLLLRVTIRLINSCCVLWCLINPADCCLLSAKLSWYIQTIAYQLLWSCERCVILPAGEINLLPNRFFLNFLFLLLFWCQPFLHKRMRLAAHGQQVALKLREESADTAWSWHDVTRCDVPQALTDTGRNYNNTTSVDLREGTALWSELLSLIREVSVKRVNL